MEKLIKLFFAVLFAIGLFSQCSKQNLKVSGVDANSFTELRERVDSLNENYQNLTFSTRIGDDGSKLYQVISSDCGGALAGIAVKGPFAVNILS